MFSNFFQCLDSWQHFTQYSHTEKRLNYSTSKWVRYISLGSNLFSWWNLFFLATGCPKFLWCNCHCHISQLLVFKNKGWKFSSSQMYNAILINLFFCKIFPSQPSDSQCKHVMFTTFLPPHSWICLCGIFPKKKHVPTCSDCSGLDIHLKRFLYMMMI